MPLRVLLAEAEVELVPEELAGHPLMRRLAQAQHRSPQQMLLDQTHHHQAMDRLHQSDRRGRPDIAQYCLVTLLESPLNRAGGLQVAMHTRNQRLVRFKPETRLPRSDSRFQGIMSRVLYQGASHDEDPLIWVDGRMAPEQALERFARGPALRLDVEGIPATPLQLVDQSRGGDLTVVIGAFPGGDWSGAWQRVTPQAVSLWPEPLNAWAVAAEVAAAFRARHGPHGLPKKS